MDKKELDKILQDHKRWLQRSDGWSAEDMANLQFADLRGMDLSETNLCCANLQAADLRGANLRGANLRGADLWSARLTGADLRGADLRGADLTYACTDGMKTDAATRIDWPMECPETGSFIAWKQAGEYIVELEIPEDALRSSATTNKCRASKARVLKIQYRNGSKANSFKTEVKSLWGKTYKLGEMVYPDDWDYNRWNECSHGIHFFMTRDEAVAW